MFRSPCGLLNECKEWANSIIHDCTNLSLVYLQTHLRAGSFGESIQIVVLEFAGFLTVSNIHMHYWKLLLSFLCPLQSVGPVLSSDIPSGTESEEDEDGMNDMNEEVMSLIWSEDLRVQEVRRLLQSARPVRVNVVQMPEASDHEYIEEKENR